MILTKQDMFTTKDVGDYPPEVAGTAPVTSRRPVRKYVIICVTCLAIMALLVIGALVAVKLITDTQREIFQYERHIAVGNTTIEDVTLRDSQDNSLVHSYHLQNSSTQSWGINDYTRNLMIAKFEIEPGTFVCLLDLNRPAVNPALLYDDSADKPIYPEVTNATIRVIPIKFNVASKPLNDTSSILGPSEQALCADVAVFLVDQIVVANSTTPVPTAGNSQLPEPSGHRRPARRATRVKRYWFCTNSWTTCTFFILSGRISFSYWFCPPVCTWY